MCSTPIRSNKIIQESVIGLVTCANASVNFADYIPKSTTTHGAVSPSGYPKIRVDLRVCYDFIVKMNVRNVLAFVPS